jgi:TetR/AcrR family transcriptional regulator
MKNHNDRLRILTFSDGFFRKHGLHRTSMDEIAGLMKISKKTIYKYYPSKEKLVEASVRHMLESSEQRISKIINARTTALEKFVLLLSEYSSEVCGVSDIWMKDLQAYYPGVWKTIDEFRVEKIYEFSKKLLRQGRKEKTVSGYPPEIILELYVSGIRAVVNPDFLLQNNFSMHKALEIVYDIFLNGILSSDGKKFYEQKRKVKTKHIC